MINASAVHGPFVSNVSPIESVSRPNRPARPVIRQFTLDRARERAKAAGLGYAGSIYPCEAWALFEAGDAVLVDVRSAEERKFVGHVPGTLHVAWMHGLKLARNRRFLGELALKTSKDQIVLFICRSGKRSAAAAEAATGAGYVNAFNVQEGFEGDLDERQQRGRSGGWRSWGLPWVQD